MILVLLARSKGEQQGLRNMHHRTRYQRSTTKYCRPLKQTLQSKKQVPAKVQVRRLRLGYPNYWECHMRVVEPAGTHDR